MTADRLRFYDHAFAGGLAATFGLQSPNGGDFPPLITALSGGADSTALCLLAARFAAENGIPHLAIVVDHGLRDGSGDEALRVAKRMRARAIDTKIVTITTTPDGSGVQEWARRVRYQALCDEARQSDACLLVGHHAGDQAETVAMRLSKGSGLFGIAGMTVSSFFRDVAVLRPMLGWSADCSVEICGLLDCAFEQDPSNDNRRFERVRVRQMLDQQRKTPISHMGHEAHPAHSMNAAEKSDLASQLTDLAGLAGRISTVVDAQLMPFFPTIHPAGFACFDAVSAAILPDPLWNRMMTRIIRQISAIRYPSANAALTRLRHRLAQGRGATLGGCKFTPLHGRVTGGTKGEVLVTREVGRRPPSMDVNPNGKPGHIVLFNDLWRIKPPVAGTLRLYGAPMSNQCGAGAISAQHPSIRANIRKNIPQQARIAIPVLDTLDGVRLYPQLEGMDAVASVSSGQDTAFSVLFVLDGHAHPQNPHPFNGVSQVGTNGFMMKDTT